MDEEVFVPIIILLILLLITYYSLGIQALSSNIFMLSIYAMFVPILFFTYGAYIEKQIVKNQVERLVESFTSDAKNLNIGIPPIDIPVDKKFDSSVKKINDDLIKKSFTILTIGFIVGVILSLVLWKYAKKTFNFKHLVYENFSLLLLVAITEIIFFGVISRNYRTLDSNGIKRYILEKIADKIK